MSWALLAIRDRFVRAVLATRASFTNHDFPGAAGVETGANEVSRDL